jgi:hypothetical protein
MENVESTEKTEISPSEDKPEEVTSDVQESAKEPEPEPVAMETETALVEPEPEPVQDEQESVAETMEMPVADLPVVENTIVPPEPVADENVEEPVQVIPGLGDLDEIPDGPASPGLEPIESPDDMGNDDMEMEIDDVPPGGNESDDSIATPLQDEPTYEEPKSDVIPGLGFDGVAPPTDFSNIFPKVTNMAPPVLLEVNPVVEDDVPDEVGSISFLAHV